jgi:hypothetical protein
MVISHHSRGQGFGEASKRKRKDEKKKKSTYHVHGNQEDAEHHGNHGNPEFETG